MTKQFSLSPEGRARVRGHKPPCHYKEAD